MKVLYKNILFLCLELVASVLSVTILVILMLKNNPLWGVMFVIVLLLVISFTVLLDNLLSNIRSYKGFGVNLNLIRSADIERTIIIDGVLIDKKIIGDEYYFLIQNLDYNFITVAVPKNIFFMKSVYSNIKLLLSVDSKLLIPGIVIKKYVENEMFYIDVENKLGIYTFCIDFSIWDKIKIKILNNKISNIKEKEII